MENYDDFLKEKLEDLQYQKLMALDNPNLHKFLSEYIELINPSSIFVGTDDEEDISYVRESAVRNGEERQLKIKGHTVHFDGYYDQARDKKNTKYLLPKGIDLGKNINYVDRDEGLDEIFSIMKDIMKGHELFIRFYCLGPVFSEFSIPAVQLTDSPYVTHSEDLLYRHGYDYFKSIGNSKDFFKFVHSEGELDENSVSKNIDKRRVYIDLQENIVYSANTQYGGNTIGLKKLAMRLAINKASNDGWLTEHMFVMGVSGPNKRVSYFTGAFPSMCGKTSTSMVEGERIVGDDIAYLRKKEDNVYAVNVEKGIFGIIQGINSKDDKLLWDALHKEGEIIFSNVLVTEDGDAFWIGKDGSLPEKGINHSGEWYPDKKDKDGNEIPISHKNSRLTLDMKLLSNRDPEMENPKGLKLSGIIYGGRDSDTWVPVEESFDWEHGIITKGASLESETTAATLGQEGVRKFNPMSNLDFLSISIGKYIDINLKFGADLKNPPKIFSVNYFLKDEDGKWLNEREDKRVWLKWMELRTNNDATAIKTPMGYIPKYEDLRMLFKDVLAKEYTEDDYVKQFTLRIPESLAKIDRIITIYKNDIPDSSKRIFEVLEEQKKRLLDLQSRSGDYISPLKLEKLSL